MTAAGITSSLVIYSLISSCECVDLSVYVNGGACPDGVAKWHTELCHHPVNKQVLLCLSMKHESCSKLSFPIVSVEWLFLESINGV